MATPKARSKSALLILDTVNPLDFEGAADITPAALGASKVIARLRKAADSTRTAVI